MTTQVDTKHETRNGLIWLLIKEIVHLLLIVGGGVFFITGFWNGVIGNYPRACFFLLMSVSFELSWRGRDKQ